MWRAIIRATLLAAIVLSVLGPASVLADHLQVLAMVAVYHGGVDPVATYSATADCAGEVCTVVVPTNNRDGGRLGRWCGDPVELTIPAGQSGASLPCSGPSTWSLSVNVLLTDGGSFPTHATDVVVTVTVQ